MRCVRATALCALVAAFAAPGASADVGPQPPCVGAGLVAVLPPAPAGVTSVGPAVTAATTQSATVPTFHDEQYGVDLAAPAAGAAGCVRGTAPGGTHVETGAWSVLGGVLSGTALTADLVPAGGDGSGWRLRARLTGLRVSGSPTQPVVGATVAVGTWGTLTVSAQADVPRLAPLRFWAAALELRVERAHAGLPAGTRVLIGYAAADRAPKPPPAPPTTTTSPTTTAPATTTTTSTTTVAAPPTTTTRTHLKPKPHHPAQHKPKRHRPKKHHPKKPRKPHGPALGQPLTAVPRLDGGDYLFPLAGRADWGDTYGGERSDVPGGWHHGDDLFAPLGTPVVAVADGTIFAVGWNRVGGWRLWLVDHAGNDFYYAHLSGYTRLARDNRAVRRGDVLGFVGNTGDAFTTDPHLHFEVHPNGFLYLGYDGAVDPTTYLRAWPTADRVHVLPPVELPGRAPTGFGSLTDFRKLLVVHPRPAKPRPARPAKPGGTRSAAPLPSSRLGARAFPGSGGGGGGSTIPIVAGIVILALALAAVSHAARDGRT